MLRTARRRIATAIASAPPSRLAVLAPQQSISWLYEELDLKARCLASGLEDIGYKPGTVAISNVPNIAENLLLQCALSHIGAAIATPPKDAEALEKLLSQHKVAGVICIDGAAPPLGPTSALPSIYLDIPEGLRPVAGSVAFGELLAHCPPRGAAPAASDASVLGIYGGAALTQSAAAALGKAAARKLGITADDRVCCSVTLMHAFGIGSAVGSALGEGACVVLPAGPPHPLHARPRALSNGSTNGAFVSRGLSRWDQGLWRPKAASECDGRRPGRDRRNGSLRRHAHSQGDEGTARASRAATQAADRCVQDWLGLDLP